MKQIAVELPKEAYLPGEIVEGRVRLSIDKTVTARAVKLDIIGLEETRITVGSSDSRTTYREHNYMLRDRVILHSPQYDNDMDLEPGNYVFKFESILPKNALPSYSGNHAVVSYKLLARVDIPLWFDILGLRNMFVFRDRYALKLLTAPVRFQSENFLAPGDKPGFSVELTKTGYVAGEVIEGTVILSNTDSSKIRKIDVELLGAEFATARGHKRNRTQKKHEIEIPVHDMIDGIQNRFYLPIPRDAPSSYEGMYSNFRWGVEVGLDIPFGFDVKALHPVEILR